MTKTRNRNTISTRKATNPPCPFSLSDSSLNSAKGSLAMIPIMIISEIPLPIPLSVILSPSHITKMVPAVRIITEETEEHGRGHQFGLTGYLCQICRGLKNKHHHGKITGDLVHFPASAFPFFLHTLEIRYCNSEQLDNDGCRNIGHNTQSKNGGL